ncbi:hypothetical protein H4219_005032 [Mycoemilia scoparia]|uniref:RING-type E3 ubiquitin transferase n=1 Tax=Mycoemilia scoparia TaxID=417184 RepID=A0A9W7ZUE7_9FUNG|nr:hypothetical protein H4219_005032 [Mycoemilia scoparia]
MLARRRSSHQQPQPQQGEQPSNLEQGVRGTTPADADDAAVGVSSSPDMLNEKKPKPILFTQSELDLLPTRKGIPPSQQSSSASNERDLHQGKHGHYGGHGGDPCPICLTVLENPRQNIRQLPCKHEFHSYCIDYWLTTKAVTCPICKLNLWNALGLDKNQQSQGNCKEEKKS